MYQVSLSVLSATSTTMRGTVRSRIHTRPTANVVKYPNLRARTTPVPSWKRAGPFIYEKPIPERGVYHPLPGRSIQRSSSRLRWRSASREPPGAPADGFLSGVGLRPSSAPARIDGLEHPIGKFPRHQLV